MARITIRVEIDLANGELKEMLGKTEEQLLKIIQNNDRGSGVNRRTISQRASHTETDGKTREAILEQLLADGLIKIVSHATGKGARYAVTEKGVKI